MMALFVNIVFLGQAFTIMLVYVWSRRNRFVRMNFFGLTNFQAPYLPWVLLGFSLMLGNSIIVDIMGKCSFMLIFYSRLYILIDFHNFKIFMLSSSSDGPEICLKLDSTWVP